MAPDKALTLTKAKSYCYRLVNIRLRSEFELRDKLKSKKYSTSIINETISFFKEIDLIDDRIFAKHWIASRLKKPFGRSRIYRELVIKGLSKSLIDEELDLALKSTSEDNIVENLAQKRADMYNSVPNEKVKQRVCAYLFRRGFSSKSIYKAINKL